VLRQVCLHQTGDGTLDGIPHLLEQLADMAGMIDLRELLRDDLGDQRGSPDAGAETCRNGAVVYDFGQDRTLPGAQAGRAAATVAFRQTFHPVLVPVLDPERHRAAMHAQGVGDDASGLSFQAHEDALNPQHHLGHPVLDGLGEQFFELLVDLEITPGKYRFHIRQ